MVEFTEYISTEGRFGYSSGGFDGIKSVLREVRAAIFKGAWRVDLKRCHTSMLLGAYNRAATLDVVHRGIHYSTACARTSVEWRVDVTVMVRWSAKKPFAFKPPPPLPAQTSPARGARVRTLVATRNGVPSTRIRVLLSVGKPGHQGLTTAMEP